MLTTLLEIASLADTFVSLWKTGLFFFYVDSHVNLQSCWLTKCLVTQATFVRFLLAMNFAMDNKFMRGSESFATISAFKRFPNNACQWLLLRMTLPPVLQKITIISMTFSTFCTLVFAFMQIHMLIQVAVKWKTSLTLRTRINLSFTVTFSVTRQICFACKVFVTDSTLIRPRLVMKSTLSSITSVSFRLHHAKLRMFSAISRNLRSNATSCITNTLHHITKKSITYNSSR